MKILMIGPQRGGIDVYVRRLTEALNLRGHEVLHRGIEPSEGAFDTKKMSWRCSDYVKDKVHRWSGALPIDEFDIIGYHFGKNDVEQYVPIALRNLGKRPLKSVYFVHFLSWNLFSEYLMDPDTGNKVRSAVLAEMDAYVAYGTRPKIQMQKWIPSPRPFVTSFYPSAHEVEFANEVALSTAQRNLLQSIPADKANLVILPGYAADYKANELLVEAASLIQRPLRIVIIGQGWHERFPFNVKTIKNVDFVIRDTELSPLEFAAACGMSEFGIFLYRAPENPEQMFQGSGTLPVFLERAKATLVLDDGVLPEYVGNAGIVVKSGDIVGLARGIEDLMIPEVRTNYEHHAQQRRTLFSMTTHSEQIEAFLQSLGSL